MPDCERHAFSSPGLKGQLQANYSQVRSKDNKPDKPTSFAVTWNWEKSPAVVHTYPNFNLNWGLLPIRFDVVRVLKIDAAWSISLDDERTGSTNERAPGGRECRDQRGSRLLHGQGPDRGL